MLLSLIESHWGNTQLQNSMIDHRLGIFIRIMPDLYISRHTLKLFLAEEIMIIMIVCMLCTRVLVIWLILHAHFLIMEDIHFHSFTLNSFIFSHMIIRKNREMKT